MATVELEHISKIYPNGTAGVSDLSLSMQEGEFLVLVGPSGCGKTTALRMVAGLEEITSGSLRINGKEVNNVAPKDRDIAMIFQSYALYPHMKVRDNLAFPLKLQKLEKSEVQRKVAQAASILGLEEILDRKPSQLSGGQRQRVAMGRAIVREPAVFLMDEPLSNLDAKLRVQMRSEISKIQRQLGVATLYVTHDQIEAMTMGDRVAVLKNSFLQQLDSPQRLYDHPNNLFVAAFIGSPSMNLFEGEIEFDSEGASLTFGNQNIHLDNTVTSRHRSLRSFNQRRIVFGIRPEDLYDASLPNLNSNFQSLKAKVSLVEALGSEKLVHFSINAAPGMTEDIKQVAEEKGARTTSVNTQENLQAEGVARFSPRSTVQRDELIEILVDTANMHFFDIDTGLSIWE